MSRWVCVDDIVVEIGGGYIDIDAESFMNAPSIEIPPMPKGDMIGYKWKLKWVLEPHPTITKVLIQEVDNESS